MKLDPEDYEAIAQKFAEKMQAAPLAIPLTEAAKRLGMSEWAFRRWCLKNGVRYLFGAKGRYSVAAINRGLERSEKRSFHAA